MILGAKPLAAIVAAIAIASAHAACAGELLTYPQDAAAYMPDQPDAPIAPFADADELARSYLEMRYSPWHEEDLDFLKITFDRVLSYQRTLAKKKFWAADGSVVSAKTLAALVAAAEIDTESAPQPGMTLEPFDLRVLPTERPMYPSLASARGSNGLLKQDQLQVSRLRAGEPVLVWRSASGASDHCYIATDAVAGWAPARCIALADESFRAEVEALPHCVAVRDDIKASAAGKAQIIKMGTLLPVKDGRAMLPIRGSHGSAELAPLDAPAGSFEVFPVPFTPRNALRAIGETIGERYGWGGIGGLRDCSALTRDYFALFAIWLPRNSGDQAEAGAIIPLKGTPVAQRAALIAERAIPFATLVHMPGHIMLYIGTKNGQPLVYHNMWGIRLAPKGGVKNRRLPIGRAVITSLYLGAEVPDRAKDALLINRIDSLTFPAVGREVLR